MPRYNPLLEQLSTYPQQALEEHKAKVRSRGQKLYDFGVGDPIEPIPDFICQAIQAAVQPKSNYPTVAGSLDFRNAVVDYLARRFEVAMTESQVLPVSGSKEAVFHLPQLLIDPKADDNVVIFPDPGYPVCYRGTLFAGGEPVPVPLTGDYIFRPWLLDESLLQRCRLMWINSPHNPSGAVMSKDDLQRTADLCRKYDIVLVSDECYADMYRTEAPHSILECGFENVLALHSLSKRSGMTGYRSGFIAGDQKIIAQLRKYRANPGLVPQSFVNKGAAVAWREDDHVQERREIFAQKKALFQSFFEELGWSVLGLEASLYLWIKLPETMDADALAHHLLDQGIVVSPGRLFALTNVADGYIRLAMVPSLEDCQEAISLWQKVLNEPF